MVQRLDICQRAAVRIGEIPIQSEADPGAEICLLTYDAITEDLFSRNPWTFSERTLQLARETEKPKGWDFKFKLPAERTGPPRTVYDREDDIKHRRPFRLYELNEDLLLTNAEQIWATITTIPPPLHWPGFMRELVTRALMAEFMLSIREDRVSHETMRRELYGTPSQMGQGGLFGEYKALDASAKPSSKIPIQGGPLVVARHGS